ncbi:MAG: hypothetical protein KF687_13940 [Cyclobacteriaceae bacterium]|nr:hypothetical protein [Cyclobacteriaceae bacterium]
MKSIVTLLLLLFIVGCSSKSVNEDHSASDDAYDSVMTGEVRYYENIDSWDYSDLYGVYLHEGTIKGFSAYLEILPEGNDLSFSLTLKQNSCTGQAEGSIGMAIHGETEYGGFYNNAECRIEFIFNLVENAIRIQEVGACRLHETGCSFNGVYHKRKV